LPGNLGITPDGRVRDFSEILFNLTSQRKYTILQRL
jgi:hypothetical protein